jgi:alpha-galactosidase
MLFVVLPVLIALFMNPLLVSSVNNGLALTPPMGWSTWNVFHCDYTELDIMEMADLMVSSGMLSAGYKYLNIDDCWQAIDRDPISGMLKYNETKFPHGMLALSNYIHSRGLLFGIYSSSGELTCEKYPGSWQHEFLDAALFSSWNVDFLKLDCCSQDNINDRATAYTRWAQALSIQNRSITYSCDSDELILKENNEEFPFQWAPQYCNMARIWWDIYDEWESTMTIIDHAANIYYASRTGYWNDLDMLTVGLGKQTIEEYTSQFSLWAIMSSPLITGNDLRTMANHIASIITNNEVIAINQNKLARSGNMIRRAIDGSTEIWAKPIFHANMSHSYHTNNRHQFIPSPFHAVVLLNRLNIIKNITLEFDDLFDNNLCPDPSTSMWNVVIRDLWLHQDLGEFTDTWTALNVPAHGVRMITVLLQDTTRAHP